MPRTEVIFFSDEPGRSPVVDWLRHLRQNDRKAFAKCVARIGRLALLGHELRRPEADYLRDGVYELRIRKGRVNYRLLYFFHGQDVAILAHALTKEEAVPEADIERALRRKKVFERAPKLHTYRENLDHG
jgi:phage-related protein